MKGFSSLTRTVLLNAYNYSPSVRGQFFDVLSKLKPRIWIPYQVGLEFNRRRLNRAKGTIREREALRNAINKSADVLATLRRSDHRGVGVSELSKLTETLQTAYDGITEALRRADSEMAELLKNDAVRDSLSTLFDNAVGAPPANQDEYDALVKDGEARYRAGIPPGFKDEEGKAKRSFLDKGITYDEKFGDLILWRQTLAYLKAKNIKAAVFVTSDQKEDWWVADGQPHYSLRGEAAKAMDGGAFWMYTPDKFLEFANKYLNAEVSKESINEVRDVSTASPEPLPYSIFVTHPVGDHLPTFTHLTASKEVAAVARWASAITNGKVPIAVDGDRLAVETAGKVWCLNVRRMRGLWHFGRSDLQRRFERMIATDRDLGARYSTIVLIVRPQDGKRQEHQVVLGRVEAGLADLSRKYEDHHLSMVLGSLAEDGTFRPSRQWGQLP